MLHEIAFICDFFVVFFLFILLLRKKIKLLLLVRGQLSVHFFDFKVLKKKRLHLMYFLP